MYKPNLQNKRGDNMFINLDREGTVEGLQYLLEQAADDENTSGVLILACDANGFTLKRLMRF